MPNTRRGPKTDFDTARQVRKIVKEVIGDADWKTDKALTQICSSLDHAEVKRPDSWRGAGNRQRSWSDMLIVDRGLLTKAIARHLTNAKVASADERLF